MEWISVKDKLPANPCIVFAKGKVQWTVWELAHKDIDLGDSRYGAGPSVEDCKRQIDEMIELEEDQ